MGWLDRWFSSKRRADDEQRRDEQGRDEQRRDEQGRDEQGRDEQHGQDQQRRAEQEFVDPYHHRASVRDGDSFMVDIGKVRERVALAIERLDLDINAAISLEADVVTLDELAFFNQVNLGGLLIADVVNTATRVMLARYPEDVVRRPLPPDYDVREFVPYTFDDDIHERARTIVNNRSRSTRDTDPSPDLDDALHGLNQGGQVELFIAVFAMSCNRLGAIKSYTGIE